MLPTNGFVYHPHPNGPNGRLSDNQDSVAAHTTVLMIEKYCDSACRHYLHFKMFIRHYLDCYWESETFYTACKNSSHVITLQPNFLWCNGISTPTTLLPSQIGFHKSFIRAFACNSKQSLSQSSFLPDASCVSMRNHDGYHHTIIVNGTYVGHQC